MSSIRPGRIVYLYGTSSAGKTSIARALQDSQREPWLLLGLDFFYDMQPTHLRNARWPLYETLCRGLHRSAAVWANTGVNVVIDAVLEKPELLHDAAEILAPYHATLVTITCPLVELERREVGRTDVPHGLARYQYERIYYGAPTDFEIDSSTASPAEVASKIIHFLSGPQPARAFDKLAALSRRAA